jgi:hypothetical protein
VTTLPLTADLDARALLGRVQALCDQTAHGGGLRLPVQLPAGSPSVPADLSERIEAARSLACELWPLLDQVCATYAEAVILAGSFGPSLEDDERCDRFFQAIGADDLGDVIYAIHDAMTARAGLNGGLIR